METEMGVSFLLSASEMAQFVLWHCFPVNRGVPMFEPGTWAVYSKLLHCFTDDLGSLQGCERYEWIINWTGKERILNALSGCMPVHAGRFFLKHFVYGIVKRSRTAASVEGISSLHASGRNRGKKSHSFWIVTVFIIILLIWKGVNVLCRWTQWWAVLVA